jgi:hypothetical protein
MPSELEMPSSPTKCDPLNAAATTIAIVASIICVLALAIFPWFVFIGLGVAAVAIVAFHFCDPTTNPESLRGLSRWLGPYAERVVLQFVYALSIVNAIAAIRFAAGLRLMVAIQTGMTDSELDWRPSAAASTSRRSRRARRTARPLPLGWRGIGRSTCTPSRP